MEGGEHAGRLTTTSGSVRGDANDRVYELTTAKGAHRAEFICECADEDCITLVPLYVAAFRAYRETGHPIVADGHRSPG